MSIVIESIEMLINRGFLVCECLPVVDWRNVYKCLILLYLK